MGAPHHRDAPLDIAAHFLISAELDRQVDREREHAEAGGHPVSKAAVCRRIMERGLQALATDRAHQRAQTTGGLALTRAAKIESQAPALGLQRVPRAQ